MLRRTILGLTVLLIGSAYSFAADTTHTTAPTTGHAAHASATDHAQQRPAIPAPSAMPGVLVMIILWMFAAAAVIGPVVRYHAPEEPPEESVSDIVAAFRQRMAEEIDATDHRTHYDLGIGYREMGLIDEAIDELQIAASAGSAELRSEACAMLALCHREGPRLCFDRVFRIP